MKIVVFGLTISSSWGNGHATLWRGLCRALAQRGHRVVFFEKDVPWYAAARDLTELPGGGELIVYPSWDDVLPLALSHTAEADAAIVTSYCPDAIAASQLVLDSTAAKRIFYDLDTSVTLARLANGQSVDYVGPGGYRGFDLVLSFTGGQALEQMQTVLGASQVAPLFGSVDPATHFPAPFDEDYSATLSYMGTWSADRDAALRTRLIEPARRLPHAKFLIGGSQYSSDFEWLPNIYFINHVPPAQHSAFFCASKLTLNVTREPMAALGYCPSGRLFEAAACGAAILTDDWPGLDTFYEPGSEILIANTVQDALDAIARDPDELAAIGRAARERTLDCHTAAIRAQELEHLIERTVRQQTDSSLAYRRETSEATTCGA